MIKGTIICRPLNAVIQVGVKKGLTHALNWGFGAIHTGVYIGDGHAIDFIGDGLIDAAPEIRRITLHEFSGGYEWRELIRPANRCHGHAVCALAEAFYRQGKSQPFGEYIAGTNDCQNFTRTCFDIEFSYKGQNWIANSHPCQLNASFRRLGQKIKGVIS